MAESFDPIAYINEPRWHNVSLGLDRIEELLSKLGNPQDSLDFVHVAGTNGKGSSCAFIAQILQESGYKVGLFTSPYLVCFEERIRVNGENIPFDDLTRVTLQVRELAEKMEVHPTEFELMTAVALLYFAQSNCDIVVLEVGLGGRLDSTNVIKKPSLCVLTSIGLDHVSVLGSSVKEIAAEKAGIIKPQTPVLSYPQEPDAALQIEEAARKANTSVCELSFDGLEILPVERNNEGTLMRPFIYEGEHYEIQLLGSYQPKNAVLALRAAEILNKDERWIIGSEAIKKGLRNTSWPGRFQLVASKPDFIIDGGHNAQGAEVLAESLQDVFPGKKPVLLVGVLADKQHRLMLEKVLPLASAVITMTPPNPRALTAESLAKEAKEILADLSCVDIPVEAGKSIEESVLRACQMAGEDGLVLAFGSLYSIGDIIKTLHKLV